ncbi:MAG TPA: polymer-forming cytoskeletal protein [Terriglobales bacterium]|nr:polymer-forming cytoskeletal protein [Terriglobales bacterium]
MTTNPTLPSQPGVASNAAASPSPSTLPPKDNPKPASSFSERADVGHIGKSVVIRGELTGNEDLYLDGDIEGTIDLRDHKLVIGPNGKIKASITAREIVIHGRLEGNVAATDRVELKKSCTLIGDVGTQRIMIEDGAFFKGAIDIKEGAQRAKAASAPSFPTSVGGGGISSGQAYNAAPASQGSFLEPK